MRSKSQFNLKEEYRRRHQRVPRDGRMWHRCCARVINEEAIDWRSSRSESELCQAPATIPLVNTFGEKWFCWRHSEIYRGHYQVVQRILAIPARPPL